MKMFYLFASFLVCMNVFGMEEDINNNSSTKRDVNDKLRIYLEVFDVSGVPFDILNNNLDVQDRTILNKQDADGNTIAHKAACNPVQTKVINFLFRHGADFNIRNNEGKTPFQIAQENNSDDIIEILKKNNITE